jgi:hypothetical protein
MFEATLTVLSSPGLTGRSRNHWPWVLDCAVKPGNHTGGISLSEKSFNGRICRR